MVPIGTVAYAYDRFGYCSSTQVPSKLRALVQRMPLEECTHPSMEGSFMLQAVGGLIRRDERGQGLAEYALILALIAVVVIAAVTLLGTQIDAILSQIANAI